MTRPPRRFAALCGRLHVALALSLAAGVAGRKPVRIYYAPLPYERSSEEEAPLCLGTSYWMSQEPGTEEVGEHLVMLYRNCGRGAGDKDTELGFSWVIPSGNRGPVEFFPLVPKHCLDATRAWNAVQSGTLRDAEEPGETADLARAVGTLAASMMRRLVYVLPCDGSTGQEFVTPRFLETGSICLAAAPSLCLTVEGIGLLTLIPLTDGGPPAGRYPHWSLTVSHTEGPAHFLADYRSFTSWPFDDTEVELDVLLNVFRAAVVIQILLFVAISAICVHRAVRTCRPFARRISRTELGRGAAHLRRCGRRCFARLAACARPAAVSRRVRRLSVDLRLQRARDGVSLGFGVVGFILALRVLFYADNLRNRLCLYGLSSCDPAPPSPKQIRDRLYESEDLIVIALAVSLTVLSLAPRGPTPRMLDACNVINCAVYACMYLLAAGTATASLNSYMYQEGWIMCIRMVQGIVAGNSRLSSLLLFAVTAVDVGSMRSLSGKVPQMEMNVQNYSVRQCSTSALAACVFWALEQATLREAQAIVQARDTQQTERLVSKLLRGLCDALVHLDSSLRVDAGAMKLAGLLLRQSSCKDPLLGLSFPDMIHREDRAKFVEYMSSSVAEARLSQGDVPPHSLHVRMLDSIGNSVDVQLFCSSIVDAHDPSQISHIVGVSIAEEFLRFAEQEALPPAVPGPAIAADGAPQRSCSGRGALSSISESNSSLGDERSERAKKDGEPATVVQAWIAKSGDILHASFGFFLFVGFPKYFHTFQSLLHDPAAFTAWFQDKIQSFESGMLGLPHEAQFGPEVVALPSNHRDRRRRVRYEVCFKFVFPDGLLSRKDSLECAVLATVVSRARTHQVKEATGVERVGVKRHPVGAASEELTGLQASCKLRSGRITRASHGFNAFVGREAVGQHFVGFCEQSAPFGAWLHVTAQHLRSGIMSPPHRGCFGPVVMTVGAASAQRRCRAMLSVVFPAERFHEPRDYVIRIDVQPLSEALEAAAAAASPQSDDSRGPLEGQPPPHLLGRALSGGAAPSTRESL